MSGDYFNTPVISVELHSMKLSLKHAILERSMAMDGWITAEIDKALSEENIKFVIERQVQSVIESVVREEVDSFYRRGDGRAIVQKLITERLAPEPRVQPHCSCGHPWHPGLICGWPEQLDNKRCECEG